MRRRIFLYTERVAYPIEITYSQPTLDRSIGLWQGSRFNRISGAYSLVQHSRVLFHALLTTSPQPACRMRSKWMRKLKIVGYFCRRFVRDVSAGRGPLAAADQRRAAAVVVVRRGAFAQTEELAVRSTTAPRRHLSDPKCRRHFERGARLAAVAAACRPLAPARCRAPPLAPLHPAESAHRSRFPRLVERFSRATWPT